MTLPSHPDHSEEPVPQGSGRGKWIPVIIVALIIAMTMTHLVVNGMI